MLTLKATQWQYDSDLNSPPGRWSCQFVESGTTSYVAGESTSRSGRSRVAIDVRVQGQLGRLMEGVVREWGFREEPDGTTSSASGLDLKALLLDFKPTSPKTYRGIQILSDSTAALPPGALGGSTVGTDCEGLAIRAAKFETFQSVAQDVCTRAGFAATFACYDYALGQDIVWEPDRSANDVLSQIVAPFNTTERFRIDLFVEANNVVRFVERGRTTPTLVEIDYLQLTRRDITESKPPVVNDVQVIGATFTFTEADCSQISNPVGGAILMDPGPRPYTLIYRTEEREPYDAVTPPRLAAGDVPPADILIATNVRTEYYDKFGRLTEVAENKDYVNYVVRNPATGIAIGVFPKVRYETVNEVFEHKGRHGEMTRSVRAKFVTDFTRYLFFNTTIGQIDLEGTANVAQYTERSETTILYDRSGDPIHSISKSWRAEPPAPTATGTAPDPTGLALEREIEERWFWSAGQRFRQATTRQINRELPGYLLNSSTYTEPATGRGRAMDTTSLQGEIGVWSPTGGDQPPGLTPGSRFPGVRGAVRQGTKEIKAGIDNSQLKFSFPVLGETVDCEYFRQKILAERAATRYEANFEMLPDLNVREGYEVRVVGVPARWRTNRFYVSARSARAGPSQMLMNLRGIAFI